MGQSNRRSTFFEALHLHAALVARRRRSSLLLSAAVKINTPVVATSAAWHFEVNGIAGAGFGAVADCRSRAQQLSPYDGKRRVSNSALRADGVIAEGARIVSGSRDIDTAHTSHRRAAPLARIYGITSASWDKHGICASADAAARPWRRKPPCIRTECF